MRKWWQTLAGKSRALEGYKPSWLSLQPSSWGLGKICLKFTPLGQSAESLAPEAVLRMDLGQGGWAPSWGRVSVGSFFISAHCVYSKCFPCSCCRFQGCSHFLQELCAWTGISWDIPGLRNAGGAGQGLLQCFLQAPETEGLWGGQTGDWKYSLIWRYSLITLLVFQVIKELKLGGVFLTNLLLLCHNLQVRNCWTEGQH